jgi:penicillin-binding protein 1C
LRLGALPADLLDLDRHASIEVVDVEGRTLYEALSETGDRGRRLNAARLPENLIAATLAAEDKRFFLHPGIDPLAAARSAWRNLRAGHVVEGGSSLTQQTVKLLRARLGRASAAEKLEEAILALRLEHRFAKREILALYLSLAPYGNRLVGAEAASRRYFGIGCAQLTPAQAAYLAGLPQGPTRRNPYRHPERALERQRWVLARMRANGALDAGAHARALEERMRLVHEAPGLVAPHFVEHVLAAAGSRPLRRVEATLDAGLQAEVAGILRMHRERLRELGAFSVAVAVLDNASAEWRAWEGSGDYGDSEHGGAIDGVVTPRQPGSVVKPFTYALAFDAGLTPASVLPDVPSHFKTASNGILYSPRNYDGAFRGPLRARLALAGSENVPAVWVLEQVGVPALHRLLRQAGLSTLDRNADHYGLALTMGDAEMRLDELVAAYAAFARGGVHRAPTAIRRFVLSDGRTEWPSRPGERRLVSERAAFWIGDILSDREARAYSFGSRSSLDLPFPAAVKTGTSTAYRDNWTIGFTRELTVGVWVGNFDRREMRQSSGVTGAAPIFHDVMLAAARRLAPGSGADGAPLVAPIEDLEPRSFCALSGQGAGALCPAVVREWVPASHAGVRCAWHRNLDGRAAVAWPAEYRAWAAARGLLHEAVLAEGETRTSDTSGGRHGAWPLPAGRTRALRIVSPPEGATYLKDPTLRDEFQQLTLRAEADAPARLRWSINGGAVAEADPDSVVRWTLVPGRHTVVVRDTSGREDRASFVVR